MMIRRVWIKTIGDNASITITDHGKRRVTLPNCSASAPPRPLRSADGGLLLPADDLGCETIAACEPILRALAPGRPFLKLATAPPMRSTVASHSSRRLPITSSIYYLWCELSLRVIRQCSDVFRQTSYPEIPTHRDG